MSKLKRLTLLLAAVLAIGLSSLACNDSGDITTTPTATPIPLGDETVTELVDGVREAGDTSDLFSDLWEAGQLGDD